MVKNEGFEDLPRFGNSTGNNQTDDYACAHDLLWLLEKVTNYQKEFLVTFSNTSWES
jgi:hypothetical protein